MDNDFAWVIERYLNGTLYYWAGRRLDDSGFSTVHSDAIRFARAEDANTVLAWILGGHGRSAQHGWISSPPPAAGAVEEGK